MFVLGNIPKSEINRANILSHGTKKSVDPGCLIPIPFTVSLVRHQSPNKIYHAGSFYLLFDNYFRVQSMQNIHLAKISLLSIRVL